MEQVAERLIAGAVETVKKHGITPRRALQYYRTQAMTSWEPEDVEIVRWYDRQEEADLQLLAQEVGRRLKS